jgi:hypothetical protein
MFVTKKNKLVKCDVCLHCARIIETDEIERPVPIVVSKVSFDNNVNNKANRDEVLSTCFPTIVIE